MKNQTKNQTNDVCPCIDCVFEWICDWSNIINDGHCEKFKSCEDKDEDTSLYG